MEKHILDLGCGNIITRKENERVIGLDASSKAKFVTVVHDIAGEQFELSKGKILKKFSNLPFKKNSFDGVRASHILEHIPAGKPFMHLMREIHRISKPSAIIEVKVPYFSNNGTFTDPTHLRSFASRSFDYFDPERSLGKEFPHYSGSKFRILERKLVFPKLFRALGAELLFNSSTFLRKIYETHLPYILPASELHFKLRVLK